MRDNNFKCDADSKVRIMEAMKNAYQPNPFTYEIDSNPTARIDCRAIGITKEGKTLHYAIECKHRNCTPSTYECYFCEPAKFDTIKWATVKDEVDKGIIANEFSDGSVYPVGHRRFRPIKHRQNKDSENHCWDRGVQLGKDIPI